MSGTPIPRHIAVMAGHARAARAVCAFALLAALSVTRVGGHDYRTATPDDDDDSLMVSETPFLRLPGQTGAGAALKLELDPCGELSSVVSGRSMITGSRLADNFDDQDADDLDPMETWLSQQSDLRVMSDGVARACGGDDLLDTEHVAELLASLSDGRSPRRRIAAISWA